MNQTNKSRSVIYLLQPQVIRYIDSDRESNTLNSVRSMRFSRHIPPKYSKRQICTWQSNHASCVPVHFVNSESEKSTLAVRMTDSEVVVLYWTYTKCTTFLRTNGWTHLGTMGSWRFRRIRVFIVKKQLCYSENSICRKISTVFTPV
jgi:hypothetical protein